MDRKKKMENHADPQFILWVSTLEMLRCMISEVCMLACYKYWRSVTFNWSFVLILTTRWKHDTSGKMHPETEMKATSDKEGLFPIKYDGLILLFSRRWTFDMTRELMSWKHILRCRVGDFGFSFAAWRTLFCDRVGVWFCCWLRDNFIVTSIFFCAFLQSQYSQ
jgi:hypothetical protein